MEDLEATIRLIILQLSLILTQPDAKIRYEKTQELRNRLMEKFKLNNIGDPAETK